MLFEFILLLFTLYLLWRAIRGNVESNVVLPPGPKKLPIIGSVVEMSKYNEHGMAPYQVLAKLSKVYGPVMHIQIGQSSQVVIEDLEIARELLMDDLWIERYYDNYWAERAFGKSLGILLVSGEGWKEMRRFSLRTLRDFGFGKQKSMEVVLAEEINDFRVNFEKKVKNSEGIVSIRKIFTISVLNILWSMMSGERFLHDDPKLLELVEMMDIMMKSNPIGANIYQAFPFLWYLVPRISKTRRNRKKLQQKLYGLLRELIKDRKDLGRYKEEQRDFFDVFLKEIDDQEKSNSEISKLYSIEQLLVVCLDLFAAGSETTSNSLEFAILYMILNPKVQDKVREEIDRVVGKSRNPSPFDRVNMPYTEATLLEVQRLGNVVPLVVRSPSENVKIGSWDIPKGTIGVFNLFSIHTSKETFKDPMNFLPERFLDDQMNVINANKVLPFGTGKRVCLGEAMAKSTLFTYFTTLIQNYTFEKVPGQASPSTEAAIGFTLSPKSFEALVKIRN